MKDTKCILVADDHAVVRYGTISLIKEVLPFAEILQASTFSEITALLNEKNVDLLILDIHMPGCDNMQVLDILRLKQPDLKILMFSIYSENLYAIRYLKAGANGYLSKHASEDEVKTAIFSILKTGKYISQAIKDNMIENLINNKKPAINPLASLSNRELEVARLLIQGLSVGKIGKLLNLQISTVSTYKNRVFEKLNVNNIADLISQFRLNSDEVA